MARMAAFTNSTKDETSERRKAHRLNSRIELSYSDGDHFFTEYLLDLSTGGLQVESSKPFRPGTELTLSILSKPPLKIKGMVRWVKKDGLRYRIGVQFITLTPAQATRIREIAQSLFWETYKA